jgi:hypothetical protein
LAAMDEQRIPIFERGEGEGPGEIVANETVGVDRRMKCRQCRHRFEYSRWYRAHYFRCPVCGWREFLDYRRCIVGDRPYPDGGDPPVMRKPAAHGRWSKPLVCGVL